MPASGATGDGLIGSAIAKTQSSISGNIPVLPEQIPVAAVAGRGFTPYGFTASAADLESSAAGFPSSPRRFSNGSM